MQVIDVKQKTDGSYECSLRNCNVHILTTQMSFCPASRVGHRLSRKKEVSHLTRKSGSPKFEKLSRIADRRPWRSLKDAHEEHAPECRGSGQRVRA